MPYVNIKPKKKTGLKFLAVDVCQRKHLQEMGESLISMSDLSKLHLLSTYEHFNKLFCSRKVIDKSILITDIKIISVH